ncbi:MAG: hypothetical protein H0V07_02820 [Propionibacteriales bacterium]|nr:hypothetical protein [Propionibacteriales bacterium]
MNAAVLLAYNPNDVKPGWIALVLVIALGVATYLLWRSMNTQLRKIQMPPKQTRNPIGQAGGDGSVPPSRPDPNGSDDTSDT